MKKVLFVSAIMCMAMAAFVACNKNDANDPEGGEGGNGKCMCKAIAGGMETPYVETPLGAFASCQAMEDASYGTLDCK